MSNDKWWDYQPILDRIKKANTNPDTGERWAGGMWLECVDTPKGWGKLVIELNEKLSKTDPDYEVHQCKEKFGGLRYYTSGLSAAGAQLVSDAENSSYKICMVCGEPGYSNGVGWIYTYCDKHWREHDEKIAKLEEKNELQ